MTPLILIALVAQTRWIDACALVGPTELAPIVGPAAAEPGKPNPVAKLRMGQCMWEQGKAPGVSASATLTITVDSSTRDPAPLMHAGNVTKPASAVLKDESVGDAAQSTLYQASAYLPARILFDVCKGRHFMVLEYDTKAPMTEHARDLLRAAAKKAAAGI